jgi:hypothetical protein
LASLVKEIVEFVIAGMLVEILFFEVLPKYLDSQYSSLPYAFLIRLLLLGIIVIIGLFDIVEIVEHALMFTSGVIALAYLVQDWYSIIISIIGIVLSLILKWYFD